MNGNVSLPRHMKHIVGLSFSSLTYTDNITVFNASLSSDGGSSMLMATALTQPPERFRPLHATFLDFSIHCDRIDRTVPSLPLFLYRYPSGVSIIVSINCRCSGSVSPRSTALSSVPCRPSRSKLPFDNSNRPLPFISLLNFYQKCSPQAILFIRYPLNEQFVFWMPRGLLLEALAKSFPLSDEGSNNGIVVYRSCLLHSQTKGRSGSI